MLKLGRTVARWAGFGVLLMTAAAACGRSEPTESGVAAEVVAEEAPAEPSAIDGDYFSGSSVLRLDAGTWTYVSGKNIRWTGEALVSGSRLTIGGEAGCSESGTYTWSSEGGTLMLEPVEDACPGRSVLLSKSWRPILPLETVDENTPEGTVVTLPDLSFTGYWGGVDVSGRTSAEIEVFIREGYSEGGWAFSPTILVGEPGQALELTVRNPTGPGIFKAEHNFALDEQGISVDIPPGEGAVVTVTFPADGALTFYCRRHVDEGQAGALSVA